MANHNRNQKPSQKPGQQQASTRPAAQGEGALDNQRIPSPATQEQSQADAENADPDRYEPRDGAFTGTDPLPGQATDVIDDGNKIMTDEDDDTVDHIAEHEKLNNPPVDDTVAFAGFEEPARTPVVVVDAIAQQQLQDADELVPVTPRRTVMRTKIGAKWYNFFKGQEQFVPAWVRDHLREKAVI